MVDLFEVVIFSGEPKYGRVGAAGRGALAGASDGGGGFERCKERTAEEGYLLAGNDDASAGAQGIEGWNSGGRGIFVAESFVSAIDRAERASDRDLFDATWLGLRP